MRTEVVEWETQEIPKQDFNEVNTMLRDRLGDFEILSGPEVVFRLNGFTTYRVQIKGCQREIGRIHDGWRGEETEVRYTIKFPNHSV